MSSQQDLNLDTSILFNYVYSKIPGDLEEDQGSQRLLDSPSFYCVIGPKAADEFETACDRRFELYDDLLDWLEENPDESIYEYDPTARDVRTSSNDLSHIRYEVQHGWENEPRRNQLSDIRRCRQDIGNFKDVLPKKVIDHVYDQLANNEDLLESLDGLGLNHDKEIISDAVEIYRKDGIDVLVAIDPDITESNQIEAINETIRAVEGDHLVLRILTPSEV